MTHGTLGRLLANLMTDMEGSNGFWHGMRHEVPVYVVSDEEHDRMRIMSPIGTLRHPDPDFLSLLLQANFDRALDAKYALRKKELWAVFMHPLSTLVPDDLGTFLDQVARLVKNTGTTYASSELIFGVNDDDRLELDDMEDEEGEGGADDSEPISFEDIEIEFESEGDDEEDDDDESWKTGQGGR
jgi:hypothetical protein